MAAVMPSFETPQERRQREEAAMRKQVAMEFAPQQLNAGDRMDNLGATEVFYGGQMSSRPKELSLVKVQRPSPNGGFEEDLGVVHRVHAEDDTVTVQFPNDQHRVRVPTNQALLVQTLTPSYPKIRLKPGEHLPNRKQLDRREKELEEERRKLGLPQGAMLPWQEADQLNQGERRDDDGIVRITGDHWGIPTPTLDALKNRSIPPDEVTGVYGRHFYSRLYELHRQEAARQHYSMLGVGGAGAYGSFGTGSGAGGAYGSSYGPNGVGGYGPGGAGCGPGAYGPGNGAGGGLGGGLGGGAGDGFGGAGGAFGGGLGGFGGDGGSGIYNGRSADGRQVVSQLYIPLEGPTRQKNPATGEWEPVQ